jgi:hypothetical protein
VPVRQEGITQMGAEETGTSSNQQTHFILGIRYWGPCEVPALAACDLGAARLRPTL